MKTRINSLPPLHFAWCVDRICNLAKANFSPCSTTSLTDLYRKTNWECFRIPIQNVVRSLSCFLLSRKSGLQIDPFVGTGFSIVFLATTADVARVCADEHREKTYRFQSDNLLTASADVVSTTIQTRGKVFRGSRTNQFVWIWCYSERWPRQTRRKRRSHMAFAHICCSRFMRAWSPWPFVLAFLLGVFHYLAFFSPVHFIFICACHVLHTARWFVRLTGIVLTHLLCRRHPCRAFQFRTNTHATHTCTAEHK